MPELLFCTGCRQRKTPDEFHQDSWQYTRNNRACVCKACRRLERYRRLHPGAPGCETCGTPKELDKNGVCSQCNAAAGLRVCYRCEELLPVPFFRGRLRTCRSCEAEERSRVGPGANQRAQSR